MALAPPDRANGWYSTSPQFQLSGFPDPDPGSLEAPPHPDHRYVYQIDDGPEIDCEPSTADGICTITGDPALHQVGEPGGRPGRLREQPGLVLGEDASGRTKRGDGVG